MKKELSEFPASFRVIGVGSGAVDVIDKVRSFGFDGVSAEVVNYPYDCTPNDVDKLAIIVFIDCDDNANRIAKTFHEAGVLTIGFSEDANTSYYDSIMQEISGSESPEVIKELLQPIVTPALISYGFNDLSTTLRDSGYFIVKTTTEDNVMDATKKLQTVFDDLDLKCVDYLSLHLYFNPNRSNPIAVSDMASLSDLMSDFPETVNAIWSVNHDENLNDDETKLSVVLAGKEVWKCSEN